MKTALVIELFGSATALGVFLGISKSAVSQWGDEVPELRAYKLREKRPTIDDELAALASSKIAA